MKFKNIFGTKQDASLEAAKEVNLFIRKNPRAKLGLATGNSVINFYRNLCELFANDKSVDYKDIISFNLDEYWGFTGDEPTSFGQYMRFNLFDHINIKTKNCHFPYAKGDLCKTPERYDKLIHENGGIDLQILGVGVNGHIGFNEPGTPYNSTSHVVTLTNSTRNANKAVFNNNINNVPLKAITMGISSICGAKKIILFCFGETKQNIAKYIFEKSGEVNEYDPNFPVSALFNHSDCTIYFDEIALAKVSK